MLLPDINVWLALAFEAHVHHPAAKNWFDALSESNCHFCRATQQGFLRLATNPKVFGRESLDLPAAWRTYDIFLSDSRISYMDEPPNLETPWRDFTQQVSYSPSIWNDAYLAAFASAANLKIVTFDRGFSQFPAISSTILS